MTPHDSWPVAIIGSGNIGTDLMVKIARGGSRLTVVAMVGADPDSVGLARAAELGIATTARGIDGLLEMPQFDDVRMVFDGLVGGPHHADWAERGLQMIDLAPSPAGPYCVPAVNLDEHLDATNLNMVTGGGQATIPIVAAIAQSGIVSYAEVVSAVPARAVGPEARADIDTVNETTSAALRVVGGARRGKAVMVLNPAEPPVLMRNTVYCLVDGDADPQRIESDVLAMIDKVKAYVPGYRLKRRVQFESFGATDPLYIPETGKFIGTRVTVLLEVAGAADSLPAYAGNLDIMTSAAVATAERIAVRTSETVGLPT